MTWSNRTNRKPSGKATIHCLEYEDDDVEASAATGIDDGDDEHITVFLEMVVEHITVSLVLVEHIAASLGVEEHISVPSVVEEHISVSLGVEEHLSVSLGGGKAHLSVAGVEEHISVSLEVVMVLRARSLGLERDKNLELFQFWIADISV